MPGGSHYSDAVITTRVVDSDTDAEQVWGTAPPAGGAHDVGDIVWNVAPSAYGAPGWICVAPGTPGTWQPMPSLGVVDTIANRGFIPPDELVDGQTVRVVETEAIYQWDSGGSVWVWLDTGRANVNRGAWVTGGTCYVDSVAGDDSTGTGLVGDPYATLERALWDVGLGNEVVKTIQIVAGSSIVLPGTIYNLDYIAITGTTTVAGTATVASVTSSSEAAGMVLNVTGLNGIANAYKGQLIQWTSGPMNARYGWIYRSDATDGFAPGETRVYNSYSGTTFLSPAPGDTFNLLTLDSALLVDGAGSSGTVINGTSVSSINFLRIEEPGGTYTHRLAMQTFPRLSFNECSIKIKEFGGFCILTCCYGNNRPASGQPWIWYVGASAHFQQGTVFDGTGVNNGARYITGQAADFTFSPGQVVFTGAWNGLSLDGCNVEVGKGSGGYTAVDSILFDPGSLDALAPAFNLNANRAFGSYNLPNLYGQIGHNYAVSAQYGAKVRFGASSALVTALGINNSVRADGTNTTDCAPDGTYIKGGYPNGWILVNAGSGISPAFTNNWLAVATWQAPAFRLTPDGFCHLDGNIGGGSSGLVAFTLPAGYRPTTQHIFAVYDVVNPLNVVATVLVTSAGAVTITCAGATTNVSLSGIHFPVAAAL